MAFITDNSFEIEMNKVLAFSEEIKKVQTIFMNTHQQLPVKERVLMIQKIEQGHKTIQNFIEKAKQQTEFNSGVKFKLENLRNRYSALILLWKKLASSL